jgi:YHS domain-containing protein
MLVGVIAVVALVCTGMEDSKVKLDGVKCVVNAKADVKADKSADYKEGKVYFCCGNCAKKFTDDSEKFATSANKQLVATGQYEQTKCPISGKDVNAAQKSTVDGIEVSYCCGNCKGKVEGAGDGAADLVFGDAAFAKGFAVVEKEEE